MEPALDHIFNILLLYIIIFFMSNCYDVNAVMENIWWIILAPHNGKTMHEVFLKTKRYIYQGHFSIDNWHLRFWVGMGLLALIDKW